MQYIFLLPAILNNKFTWTDLISGFSQKKDENYDINRCNIYNIEELYNG